MSIEVGAKLSGKVSGITNFGAFIDLGEGKTGLVHISEVSNGFVKDINDILSVGDEVTVKVTSVGDDGKVGLSIRKAQDNPEAPKSNFQRRNNSSQDNRSSQQDNRDRGHHSAPKKQFNKPVNNHSNSGQDFDSLMSSFLKDSDDRLSSLRRNTEGKRGGRGGRRN
ncbi:RNA-binding protein S1 [Enterococcus sp. BWB1-3]|uniref:S1 domain-containing RNA-binding protein n=1 Tax=unclassified Enterococcus TaxID=2608891 RepID=UPI001924617F|nr:MULTISPECIES: S1 domain-containing RNA-binding protein [unclassified Enterococcus]MBL1230676.1 RNA-binding protein S1 [Enterococcus sp. BWB1-3]MCB5952901.1 RNA-binding protein S1 [Enterococcus sp. BWT-B8]MCB5953591.1 RNA-binding protein S1 [Enterococcus sp. CWB-B31]